MSQQYSARGKIMLTGEYLALYGAEVLARPTHKQQHLSIFPGEQNGVLDWVSLDEKNIPWFSYKYAPSKSQFHTELQQNPVAKRLWQIIQLNIQLAQIPNFLAEGLRVVTSLEWPRDWGLGSSSSLLFLISQWLGTDPFEVQRRIFGGSGYDIACAGSDHPILYQLQEEKAHFSSVNVNPDFERHAAFAWLGKKADTHAAIRLFRESLTENSLSDSIRQVNDVTQCLLSDSDPQRMCEAIRTHESVVAKLLNTAPVGYRYFKDFNGAVKSCGAWGGDFILFFGCDPVEFFIPKFENKYGLKLFLPDELLVS